MACVTHLRSASFSTPTPPLFYASAASSRVQMTVFDAGLGPQGFLSVRLRRRNRGLSGGERGLHVHNRGADLAPLIAPRMVPTCSSGSATTDDTLLPSISTALVHKSLLQTVLAPTTRSSVVDFGIVHHRRDARSSRKRFVIAIHTPETHRLSLASSRSSLALSAPNRHMPPSQTSSAFLMAAYLRWRFTDHGPCRRRDHHCLHPARRWHSSV